MHGADANEAGLLPVTATVPVFPVLFAIFVKVVFPVLIVILEDERRECGVLQIFGLVYLDSSSHQEAEGVFGVPVLESAAHFIGDVQLILRSSSWVGAPGLTFILGVGNILGI